MKPMILRGVTFFVTVIACVSFFPLVTGSDIVSLALLFSLAVSSTLLKGFTRTLPFAVLLGLAGDIVFMGTPGPVAVSCVTLSYAASFSSRRIMTDRGAMPILVFGTVIGLSVIGFRSVVDAAFPPDFEIQVAWPLVSGLVVFSLAFPIFRKFETWTSSFDAPNLR